MLDIGEIKNCYLLFLGLAADCRSGFANFSHVLEVYIEFRHVEMHFSPFFGFLFPDC